MIFSLRVLPAVSLRVTGFHRTSHGELLSEFSSRVSRHRKSNQEPRP